jgi:DNA-binding NarL/FixJ family response regulator
MKGGWWDMNAPRGSNRPIRLLLVDHQPSVRRGLKMRLALEEDLEVVGEAADATEAITLARALRPDVVLMDIETPGMSGVAAAQRLRVAAPYSAAVIFTLRDDAVTREQARAAGAAAFVAKHGTEEALLTTIRSVATTYGKQGRHDRAATGTEEYEDDTRERRDT